MLSYLKKLEIPRYRESVVAALVFLSLAIAQDIYYFWAGNGWTPIQYESLASLLIIGQTRFSRTSGLVIFLFLCITKIIYFQFGLDFLSIQESRLGIIILAGLVSIAAIVRIHQWRQLALGGTAFALAFAFLTVVDKEFTNDMAASSYLSGIFASKMQSGTTSTNLVYQHLMRRSMDKKGSVLVVWESLGVPLDKVLLAQFEKNISPAKLEVVVHEGGSTVTAEARYLCGVNGRLPETTDCIPQYIDATAMHGNTLSYFNRASLYRKMGFRAAIGRADLQNLKVCRFAYTAICDDALLDELLAQVRRDRCEGFSYILTIDSHFPYLKYSDHPSELLADVTRFLQKFEALRHELPDCELIVAGDHPPPLSKGFEAKSVLVVRR